MSSSRKAPARTEFVLNDITAMEVVNEENTPVSPEPLEDADELTYPDGGVRAWSVVAGCFFGLMADFGLLNSIGAIEAYVSSHQLENFSTLSVSWIFSLYVGLSYMFGIISGVIFDEIGARIPMAAGSIFIFAGIFSTANCTKPYQFILAFGILGGMGNALCMNPLIGVISHWFMNRRGFAIGIATVGGSVGGIIFPLLLNSLYERVGFLWGMRILAFMVAAMLAVSYILIKERPELRKALEVRSAERDGYEDVQIEKRWLFYVKNAIDFKALKELKFSICAFATTMLEVGLVCSLTFFSSYALKVSGASVSEAFNVVAIVNGTSIAGRCVPNFASDKYGVFNTFIIMSLVCLVLQLVLWLGFGSNLSVLYGFAVVYGFFCASVQSLVPVACAAVSPTRRFGRRYALMCVFWGLGCLVGVPLAGSIIGSGEKANYDNFIIFLSSLTTAGTLGLILCRYVIVGLRLRVKV